MKVVFYKYQGTGNDFIIIDNRDRKLKLNAKQIAFLCDRHFGVGADGLMFMQDKKGFDFEMVYYNSNGKESSFCGNGSRCIVAFADELGLIDKTEAIFLASDGIHSAKIIGDRISIKMNDVKYIETEKKYCLLNTGSPHYVKFSKTIKDIDVVSEGREIRNNNKFKKEGINVNFVEKRGKSIYVRTYERGVEDETLSCGTGVTASALAASAHGVSTSKNHCKILTQGGELTVRFIRGKNSSFTDIWLEGEASYVFKGEIEL